jgi:hypothetical protein
VAGRGVESEQLPAPRRRGGWPLDEDLGADVLQGGQCIGDLGLPCGAQIGSAVAGERQPIRIGRQADHKIAVLHGQVLDRGAGGQAAGDLAGVGVERD